jgi:hypothetical protein
MIANQKIFYFEVILILYIIIDCNKVKAGGGYFWVVDF